MTELQNFSTGELEAELEKREQFRLRQEFEKAFRDEMLKKEKELLEKPKRLNQIHADDLVKICETYVTEMWTKEYVDEELSHYIFETAMICVFGADIFERIAQHTNRRK